MGKTDRKDVWIHLTKDHPIGLWSANQTPLICRRTLSLSFRFFVYRWCKEQRSKRAHKKTKSSPNDEYWTKRTSILDLCAAKCFHLTIVWGLGSSSSSLLLLAIIVAKTFAADLRCFNMPFRPNQLSPVGRGFAIARPASQITMTVTVLMMTVRKRYFHCLGIGILAGPAQTPCLALVEVHRASLLVLVVFSFASLRPRLRLCRLQPHTSNSGQTKRRPCAPLHMRPCNRQTRSPVCVCIIKAKALRSNGNCRQKKHRHGRKEDVHAADGNHFSFVATGQQSVLHEETGQKISRASAVCASAGSRIDKCGSISPTDTRCGWYWLSNPLTLCIQAAMGIATDTKKNRAG